MKKSLGPKTLLFPTPVLVVGVYDADDRPNIMTAAWGGICCSQPVCINVSLRKATYTYGNIVAKQAFTVSIPSQEQVAAADYAGLASGRDADKFATAGLTAVRSELVNAPYVAEFPHILECKLAHTLDLGLHTLFVGEVMDVKVDENCLDDKGNPDVEKTRPLAFIPGARLYYGFGACVGEAFSIGKKFLKPE